MLRADDNLAEHKAASDLNDRFYRSKPHQYFSYRLHLLMLAGDPSVDLHEFIRKGITVDGFTAGPTDAPEDPESAEHRQRYVLADAAALLHHVSETLLRLYLAHEHLPPCPWLEIARERHFASFKRRVRARFVEAPEDDAANRDALAQVFHGTTDRTKLTPQPPADLWAASLENIEQWLRFYAHEFLENASLYNSVKHGLAVQPGESAMKLGDGSVISAEGPAIDYLEERERDGRREWVTTTHWLNVGHLLAASFVGIRLIYGIWAVARTRYTGAPWEGVSAFTEPKVKDVLLAAGEGVVITKMQINLPYYLPEADALDQTSTG